MAAQVICYMFPTFDPVKVKLAVTIALLCGMLLGVMMANDSCEDMDER